MRKMYAFIILICIAYFAGGWLAVQANIFDKSVYIEYAGIVGGLASVTGLFALTRPALSKSDVQAVEIEALKSMTETASQLQTLETERSKTKGEIDALEIKKREMELLVKKASLALFLKEQHAQHERQIIEEIEANPNVEQLKEIIATAGRRPVPVEELVKSMPFPMNSLFHSLIIVNNALSKSVFPFKQ